MTLSHSKSLSAAELAAIDNKLETAFNWHQQGQLAAAANLYQQILAIQPQHFDALRLLALILRQQDNQAALALFDQAVHINPLHPGTWNNRGNTLLALQRPEQAVASYERALQLKVDYAEAYLNKGLALFALQHLELALASYTQAIHYQPNYAEAYFQRGVVLAALNQPELALASYNSVLKIQAQDTRTLNNRGIVLVTLNMFEQALASYEQALVYQPQDAEILINRANVLVKLKQLEPALASYELALSYQPDSAVALNNRGVVLQALKQPTLAIESYTQALELSPNYLEALHNQASLLMEFERFAEAEACLTTALQLKPDFIHGLYSLSLLTNGKTTEELHNRLCQIAQAKPALSPEEAVLLQFSLGRSYQARKNYGRAFTAFTQAGQLQRQTLDYDAQQMSEFFTKIQQVFDPQLLARLQGFGHPSTLPIFVVGMPRSGTTLIEQIISSHPQVYGAGELFDFMQITQLESAGPAYRQTLLEQAPRLFAVWAQQYVDKLHSYAPTAKHVTDKMTSNFFALGLIHLLLPQAKIIHVNRNPIATCWSCYSTWFKEEHAHTYDLGELGRYYLDYAQLMQYWRQVLPAQAFLEINYEEVITDQEGQTRRILDYCGLDWHPVCLEFHKNPRQISTASSIQARQPLYSSAVERWRVYEPYLQTLKNLLADLDSY